MAPFSGNIVGYPPGVTGGQSWQPATVGYGIPKLPKRKPVLDIGIATRMAQAVKTCTDQIFLESFSICALLIRTQSEAGLYAVVDMI